MPLMKLDRPWSGPLQLAKASGPQLSGAIRGIWVPGPSPKHRPDARSLAKAYALRTSLLTAEIMRLAFAFSRISFCVISAIALLAPTGLATPSLMKSNMSFSNPDLRSSCDL